MTWERFELTGSVEDYLGYRGIDWRKEAAACASGKEGGEDLNILALFLLLPLNCLPVLALVTMPSSPLVFSRDSTNHYSTTIPLLSLS